MQPRPPYLVGADIGTSGFKTCLIDARGTVLGAASRELTTAHPHPGWCEQDPEDWYRAFGETLLEAREQAGVAAPDIAALCIDAAAHTPVLTDEAGSVLRPAIMWTDQRTGEQVRRLEAEHGDEIFAIGYQAVNPTWTLPQLLWVAENEPEVARRTARVFIAKDYLRWRLTGAWGTDPIDAMSTLLFDARRRRWSPRLIELARFRPEQFPPVQAPSSVAGEVLPQPAQELGLEPGTPVITGTSDSALEMYGAGAVEPGQCVVKLATAAYTNVVTDSARPHRRTLTYYHVVPDMWYSVAATNSCASALRWFRDVFCRHEVHRAESEGGSAFAMIDELAASAPAGSEGVLFHPYLLGERSPHWDPDLRASLVGLSMRHDIRHVARAVLEGIAFSLRDCLSSIESLGFTTHEARIIGGGAASPLWRQITSDVLGLPLVYPENADASFGAALLAGVGIGVFTDERDAVKRCVKLRTRTEPDKSRNEQYQEIYELYRMTHAGLADVYHRARRTFG
ncbi:MAG: xylulokinase [Planctomycetes bacterium]|nr:xylulokinase [Planctomycetota bacterium]